MSSSGAFWTSAAIWMVSIFSGIVALALTQSIFNLFFVPIVIGILWDYTRRVGRLEERLSQIELKLSVDLASAGKEDSRQ